MNLIDAARIIEQFSAGSFNGRVAQLEHRYSGIPFTSETGESLQRDVTIDLLQAALLLKRTAGQINEVIHAVGILMLLPDILLPSEQIQSLSLAAGNTGRHFDLETNLRIAEFKFIQWRGGSESIRQNQLFKDFFYLAEEETEKERNLYVIDTRYPLKFLMGGRALDSVMSKDNALKSRFAEMYKNRFSRVKEYYLYRRDRVKLVGITTINPRYATIFAQESGLDT